MIPLRIPDCTLAGPQDTPTEVHTAYHGITDTTSCWLCLQAFAFSIENFQREDNEVKYLFALMARRFAKDLPQLLKLGVKVGCDQC